MLRFSSTLSLALFLGLYAGGAGAQAPDFDGRRAFALLERQVAFGPRVPGTEAHARCLAWMQEHLKARAERVVPHVFVVADPRGEGRLQLTNLKASFALDAPRRIALAAHWDTRPYADRDSVRGGRARFDGANDGASGVAVLLHLAELMAALPPPIGVDLLLFDGEDYGEEGRPDDYLLGSRRFARDFGGYRPEGLILLDMVGDADLRIPMEGHGLRAAPALTRRVFAAATRLGLPAFDPVPGPAVLDDHVPFLERGIPAIDLIDFDYPAWHTTADTADRCSPTSLGQVGTLLAHLVYVDLPAGP